MDRLQVKRGLEDRAIGELLIGGAEGLLRRNPHWLAKFKMGEALSGIIELDNKEKEEFEAKATEETEATFSKKESAPSLSEEDKDFLDGMKWVKGHFEESEFDKVMGIVAHFSKHKQDIATVIDLLNIKPGKAQ